MESKLRNRLMKKHQPITSNRIENFRSEVDSSLEKYYYFVCRGCKIYDIAYSYDNIDHLLKMDDIEVELITDEDKYSIGRIITPISDVYKEKQPFMKENNRRESNINKILS